MTKTKKTNTRSITEMTATLKSKKTKTNPAYTINSCPQHKHNNINTLTIQTPDNIENDENQENEHKIKNPNIHRTIETPDNIENDEYQ